MLMWPDVISLILMYAGVSSCYPMYL